MNILVTGGCGFIPSHFCRNIMQSQKYKTIVNIDCLYPCATKSKDLTTSHDNYVFVQGNINDQKLVYETLVKYEIDIIVHMSAQSHVDLSFTSPLIYTIDNVLGTHHLLEAVRDYGKIKRFIQFSTDEVYSHPLNDLPMNERSLLNPSNPYSSSKACAEMLVNSYIMSYGLPAIIMRPNNIYSSCQYPEKVIPKFIRQIQNNEKITIHGDGSQKRSFLHTDDIITAINIILEEGVISQIYNVSADFEITVKDLAVMLLKMIKPDADPEDYIIFVKNRNFNDKRYFITSEPLEALGWKRTVDFEEGLRRTVAWYLSPEAIDYWVGEKKTHRYCKNLDCANEIDEDGPEECEKCLKV
jgi:UDP-glucose 4,6-dehydratase